MTTATLLILSAFAAAEPAPDRPAIGATAISIQDAMDAFKKTKVLPPVKTGVVVLNVLPESPAAKAGMQPMDLITRIDQATIKDGPGYRDAINALKTGTPAKIWYRRLITIGARAKWEAQQTTVTPATAAEIDRLATQTCPLECVAGKLRENIIDIPEAVLKFRNRTHQPILAFTVEIECFNNFDEPVRDFAQHKNVFRGISQTTIQPAQEETSTWTLHLHENTTKATVRIVRVKLADGTEWTPSGKTESFKITM